MDDHNAFDLAKYVQDNNIRPMDRIDTSVDPSGKPRPENVRVILNSGLEVKCDTKFDGYDTTDNTRRYRVVAEIDWENYWPTVLLVGEYPSDVTLALLVPGASDEDHQRMARGLQTVPEKIINVS